VIFEIIQVHNALRQLQRLIERRPVPSSRDNTSAVDNDKLAVFCGRMISLESNKQLLRCWKHAVISTNLVSTLYWVETDFSKSIALAIYNAVLCCSLLAT
jgi:hypothetical protein